MTMASNGTLVARRTRGKGPATKSARARAKARTDRAAARAASRAYSRGDR